MTSRPGKPGAVKVEFDRLYELLRAVSYFHIVKAFPVDMLKGENMVERRLSTVRLQRKGNDKDHKNEGSSMKIENSHHTE